MRMLIYLFVFACTLYHGIHITSAAQGLLMMPPPRSYTTLTFRTSLVNDHPCGNNAFSTQYPYTSSIYSDFVHQRVLSKDSQYITEGSLLNVTWLPIFFSSNTSYYQFSLCMDTSLYTYTKCIVLSEHKTNATKFNLNLNEYDINAYDSGYNYHWTSVTDRFSLLDHHLKHHSLEIPDHMFHSLGIVDTDLGEGNNISATLIWQWVVSDYETIDNCADIIILPQDDDNEDHSTLVVFEELENPTILPLPGATSKDTNQVCMVNPNGTEYSHLDYANVGKRCGPEIATCAPGQCCNKDGVCGPYTTSIYEYYYQNSLLESIPVYTALPNFGFLDALSASMSFCETDVVIDNRYIPDSNYLQQDGHDPNDFIDLCWKCTKNNPKECSYEDYFATNGTTAITNVYKFYDASDDNSNSGGNNGNGNGNGKSGNGSSSGSSGVVNLVVIILFLTLFCCIFFLLFRTYKSNNTKLRTTKRRLLDLQVDDGLNKDNSGGGVSSVIDATGAGANLHSNEEVTFGQHGYSDDSDADSNSKDPLDVGDDSDQDKVGGILGRASLDATSSTDKPLPDGWEEYRTDAGERYYHHPERNVTQWEKPE